MSAFQHLTGRQLSALVAGTVARLRSTDNGDAADLIEYLAQRERAL